MRTRRGATLTTSHPPSPRTKPVHIPIHAPGKSLRRHQQSNENKPRQVASTARLGVTKCPLSAVAVHHTPEVKNPSLIPPSTKHISRARQPRPPLLCGPLPETSVPPPLFLSLANLVHHRVQSCGGHFPRGMGARTEEERREGGREGIRGGEGGAKERTDGPGNDKITRDCWYARGPREHSKVTRNLYRLVIISGISRDNMCDAVIRYAAPHRDPRTPTWQRSSPSCQTGPSGQTTFRSVPGSAPALRKIP